MISVLWTLPEAGAIIKPKPPPFRLFVRNPQPLTSPDPFDALVVHVPARLVEQCGDRPIAVAAILTSQLDDVLCKLLFIWPALGNLALGRTVLTQCAAGPTLGDAEVLPHQVNALAPA